MCEECEANPVTMWEPIHDTLPAWAVHRVTPTRSQLVGRVVFLPGRGWVHSKNTRKKFDSFFDCTDDLLVC